MKSRMTERKKMLIDNSKLLETIMKRMENIKNIEKDELIIEPFTRDFARRFC